MDHIARLSGAPRIGLVLGGGGMTGMAFHAGALQAVEAHLQLDLHQVELIVGTSAGALVGALLRGGARPADLAAWCGDGPLAARWARRRAAVQQDWDRLAAGRWRLPLRMPWSIGCDVLAGRDWRAAALALLPEGGADHQRCVSHFASGDRSWPERATWVCAVERPSGERVVFGRDRVAPLDVALAASSAVPGLFRAVGVEGRRYCDGGVRSTTNLDLVAGEPLDGVIVCSPLSLCAPPALADALPTTVLRRMLHHQLAGERTLVRRSGLPVLAVEPDWEVLGALGFDAMAGSRLDDVVRAAGAVAGALLRSDEGVRFTAAIREGHSARAATSGARLR